MSNVEAELHRQIAERDEYIGEVHNKVLALELQIEDLATALDHSRRTW
jgi:hypothetical protein